MKKIFFTSESISQGHPEPPEIQKEKKFSFDAPDVLEVLKEFRKKRLLEYIGSATSDFQAEPLLFDQSGEPIIFSDWEAEVVKSVKGLESKIETPQQIEEFPHFRKKKKEYLGRSKEIGEKMFRFSLDFARLCPKEGEFNLDLMADYIRTLARIKAQGQEPMLTIFHWPMPKYLIKERGEKIIRGGWENPQVAKHFRFYIEQVVKSLNDENWIRKNLEDEGFDKDSIDKFLDEGLVRYFISINEPINIFSPGYLQGVFPPFKKGKVWEAKAVFNRLIKIHDLIREEIKTGLKKVEPQVGIAHNWTYFDGALGKIFHSLANRYITKRLERWGDRSDFLALQYYFRNRILPLTPSEKPQVYSEHPGFGDIYPKGIYQLLKKMHKMYPYKEIFITEFGFSDKNDIRRPLWILETVRYILEAIKDKVPIKGMMLWSLVNNFEWARGMEQKFGLFDESELDKPLKPDPERIRSWEVWQMIIKTISDPSESNLKELENYYQKAQAQFK